MKQYIKITYRYYCSYFRDETDYFEATDEKDAINQLKKKTNATMIHDLEIISKKEYESILQQKENYNRWNTLLNHEQTN